MYRQPKSDSTHTVLPKICVAFESSYVKTCLGVLFSIMYYNDEIMKPLIYSFGVNPNLSAYLILLIERKVILTASLLATVKKVSRFSIDILVLC